MCSQPKPMKSILNYEAHVCLVFFAYVIDFPALVYVVIDKASAICISMWQKALFQLKDLSFCRNF